ncbi:nucleoplasmin isoform X2 [Xenopus laevis]|uniref:Nucleoplasmin isoform X2 n=1 Tax=Xenopus laevis TaxID=8355 RepID=A0A8J0UT60_XENLA|nr:nucleoplasmin isoform X2 [Xenopus laevis]
MSSDELQLSSIHSESDKRPPVVWGCVLSKDHKTYVFKPEDDFLEHLLKLWTICLATEAKDETNVVAAELHHTQGKPITIASLRPSVLPMINVNGLEFSTPVTFTLKSGSGPVYISGIHISLDDVEDVTPENLF